MMGNTNREKQTARADKLIEKWKKRVQDFTDMVVWRESIAAQTLHAFLPAALHLKPDWPAHICIRVKKSSDRRGP